MGKNNLYVNALFNQTDTIALNFNMGTTELVLINSVLKNKLKAVPKLYTTSYDLKIGKTDCQTKIHDAKLTAQETDGRFNSTTLFKK
jgi:hypothetical protein